jgi:hypothetical protein
VNFPDPDSFYHLRHAWVYATRGLAHGSFPWLEFSLVGRTGADLWYGFHVLLVPLTGFGDLRDGLIYGGVLCTAGALALVYWSLVRLGVAWPLVWTAAFCFCAGPVTFRLLMLRPHALSLGLSLVVFALAADAGRRRWFLAGVLAALSAWLHLALSWLPLLFALAGVLQRGRPSRADARTLAAVAGGVAAGALLRPHPFGALELAWVQVVEVLRVKRLGVPLLAGRELWPLAPGFAAEQTALLACLVLVALAALVVRRRGETPWALLALCLLFTALTLRVAARALEIAAATAVLFAASAVTLLAREAAHRGARRAVTAVSLALVAALPVRAVPTLRTALARGVYPPEFREVSRWLEGHTRAGDVVFHLHWDQFAQLFFWNTHNHYVNGMDPIFAYAFDPRLYWKVHMLAIDRAPAFTCGAPVCGPENSEPTPLVLARDFRASHVLVKTIVNPAFAAYARAAPEFEVVFDNGEEVVFRLVAPARAAGAVGPGTGGA